MVEPYTSERSPEETIQLASAYLEAHNLLTMATASKDGEPDATALEYTSDGLEVYVTCRPNSMKARNILENPRVFYEVHDVIPITRESVLQLKALQVAATGNVIYPEDPAFDEAFQLMVNKFPVFATLNRTSRVVLHFTPRRLWYLNYKDKFFHRDEVVLDDSPPTPEDV
jgi:hypothetical protein